MKFQRRPRPEVSVELTPLIDVVFLLLIFFMVSTSFIKEEHLTIDLPEAEGAPLEAQPQQLEVVISEAGDYAVNGRALANRRITTLMAALEQVSSGNTDLPLVITADGDAPHRAVVTAMDAAGRLGFTRQSIATRPAGDGEDGAGP